MGTWGRGDVKVHSMDSKKERKKKVKATQNERKSVKMRMKNEERQKKSSTWYLEAPMRVLGNIMRRILNMVGW
jgi:hypothetical protein